MGSSFVPVLQSIACSQCELRTTHLKQTGQTAAGHELQYVIVQMKSPMST